jgi:hypothetical protein
MPLLVKISPRKASSFSVREGVSSKTGKPYEITSQAVSVFFPGEDESETITINLPRGHRGYPAGVYVWPIELSLVRGSFDAPRIGDVTLVSLADFDEKPFLIPKKLS